MPGHTGSVIPCGLPHHACLQHALHVCTAQLDRHSFPMGFVSVPRPAEESHASPKCAPCPWRDVLKLHLVAGADEPLAIVKHEACALRALVDCTYSLQAGWHFVEPTFSVVLGASNSSL